MPKPRLLAENTARFQTLKVKTRFFLTGAFVKRRSQKVFNTIG